MEQEGEHNGRIFFKQRETEADGEAYIYFEQNAWKVSDTLGRREGKLQNRQVTKLPPQKGWQWHHWAESHWRNDDSTLALEFASLPSPCQLVEVEGDAAMRKHHASKLGNYTIQQNRWSRGRPVYQLNSTLMEMYLLVMKGISAWSFSSSTTGTSAWGASGRATNSPTDVEAAGNVWLGQTRGMHSDDRGVKEGNITVKCLD